MKTSPVNMALVRGLFKTHSHIVIIGLPASGKTTLVNDLKQHWTGAVYHTDDYIKYGFEDSLYVLLDDLKREELPGILVEGVTGFRLLRKLAQYKQQGTPHKFSPTLVILCTRSKELREQTATERGKLSYAAMDKTLQQIYSQYRLLAAQVDFNPREIVIYC